MALGKLTKPNILILLTDQQRTVQHFPKDWAETWLPSLYELANKGISFPNAICNSLPCTPSRGVLISGLYPQTNQVTGNFDTLDPSLMNLAKIMQNAGYQVAYKGKWHLNESFDEFAGEWKCLPVPTAQAEAQEEDSDMAEWGWQGWTSPDFGTDLVTTCPTQEQVANLGGGDGGNDSRIVSGANSINPSEQNVLAFLAANQNPSQPFCLIVSILNPHDVSVYPDSWCDVGYDDFDPGDDIFKYFTSPLSYNADNLQQKPDAQLNWLNGFDKGRLDDETALNYLKFYAFLQMKNESLFKSILTNMDRALIDNTIIIRIADHGEMGTSHYGLREKENVFYQEAINVPMIFSNPVLWPVRLFNQHLVSLIDLVPTLATIVGADTSGMNLQGIDFSSALLDQSAPTQDACLFTMLDGNDFKDISPDGSVNKIAAIVTDENNTIPGFKYAVWYKLANGSVDAASMQFEMYSLTDDPSEMNNLAPKNVPDDGNYPPVQISLHQQLSDFLHKKEVAPSGWPDTLPA